MLFTGPRLNYSSPEFNSPHLSNLSSLRNEIRSPHSRLTEVRHNGRGQEDEDEDPRLFPDRVFSHQETKPARGVHRGGARCREEDRNETEQVPYPVEESFIVSHRKRK